MKTIATTRLPVSVEQPNYSSSELCTKIVHLGFGAFHRAHQALFTHRVLNKGDSDWGICAVNLIGGEALIAQLQQQAHRYTVLELGAQSNRAIVVGAISTSMHVTDNGIDAILNKMAEPQVAIVSLTITEKGYCLLPGRLGLDLDHPLIQHDLASPDTPMSAPGVIVAALKRRRDRALKSFTVLSCDNMPENGLAIKDAVISLAQKQSSDLADWIVQHVTFPSTMVDRIVPAVTEETLDKIESTLGVRDPCGVACEPFIQWVIEDDFVNGRPDWHNVGAELVDNVIPYEEMKLRMLNGSHSFLAYLGYLAGYPYISSCMQDPAYRHAAYALMVNEQAPTLSVLGVDLADYANRLIERYENPSLKHQTAQIAMDGTQKLPQRLLDSVRWHIKHHRPFDGLALGVAGWMRYVGGIDDQGNSITLNDPMSETLKMTCQGSADGQERVLVLLSLHAIFGADLANNPLFVRTVTDYYEQLRTLGSKKTVENYVAGLELS